MSEELKTLEQILHEAYCEVYARETYTNPVALACAKRAAAAVRAAVIERECLTEGWRLLEEGEVVQEDDQYLGHNMKWRPTLDPGRTVRGEEMIHRYSRRCLIPAAQPSSQPFRPGQDKVPDRWETFNDWWNFENWKCEWNDDPGLKALLKMAFDAARKGFPSPVSSNPPDTSTLAGKIAVMQAALEGAEIESKSKITDDNWGLSWKPSWDWISFDYRVKPATPFDAYMAKKHPGVERGSDDWQTYQGIWTAATEGGAE